MLFLKRKLFVTKLILIVILFNGKLCKSDQNSARLIRDLLTGYNPMIIPSKNSSMPVQIYFKLYLHNIIEVNAKNLVLTTNCWFRTDWVDYKLQWNSSNYGGLERILIPSELIWKHDIILHNTVGTMFQSSSISSFANVSHTGEVFLFEQAILFSSCTMDISYFPFDTQTCHLQWESWSYDITEIDIFQNGGDQEGLTTYEYNGEFELLDFVSNKSILLYDDEWYADIKYTLKLRRRPLAYVFNLIIPCGLIDAIGKLCKSDQNSARLIRDLLTGYNPMIIPSKNSSMPVQIYFKLYLHNIIEVNAKNLVLTTNCWFRTDWVDYKLQWNSSDYGGLERILIPSELIWKHDIILHNTVGTMFQSSSISSFANVSHTGEVFLFEQAILFSSCTMDISYFPFDTQTCHLQWESWSYDITEIDIFQNGGDHEGLTTYEDNGEFELLDFVSNKSVLLYDDEWYADIKYTLKLRRRPLAYVFNLIIPCGLIDAIALLVFYMPSQTGEKVTLGISSLISMTVFLMDLKDSLPATGILSIINIYYGVSMILVTFATSLSVLTLNIYYQGEKRIPLPGYLKRFVNCLSRLVFIPAWTNFKKQKTDKQGKCNYTFRSSYSKILEKSTLQNDPFETYEKLLMTLIEKHGRLIENHEKNLYKQDKLVRLHQEWQHASVVLDRLFLVVFVLITVITSFVILCSKIPDYQQHR